jgi:phenylacetic acid degradation operon negative regulatory protein
MKAKTEELLYVLLWTCDMMVRPTFRNLTDSFESWSYRRGLHLQLARLERRKLIESQRESRSDRAYRLTDAGRLHALGGRDPEACWSRPWDGRWRLVLFDYPRAKDTVRDNLRRYLRQRGFGHLQNSVWITPDPLTSERAVFSGGKADVESLILLEARPAAGETDDEIVVGAWDFSAINRCYEAHLAVLEAFPSDKPTAPASTLQRWYRQEQAAWIQAVSKDPLLPEQLLPRGYLGRKAWRTRLQVLGKFAAQACRFAPANEGKEQHQYVTPGRETFSGPHRRAAAAML